MYIILIPNFTLQLTNNYFTNPYPILLFSFAQPIAYRNIQEQAFSRIFINRIKRSSIKLGSQPPYSMIGFLVGK